MIKLKLLIGMCILVLLSASAMAITDSNEVTSVSRVTGNSAEDIISQLDSLDSNLQHASYYENTNQRYGTTSAQVRNILDEHFDDVYSPTFWNDVDEDQFQAQELLIIDSDHGQVDLTSLKDEFSQVKPVIILDVERGRDQVDEISRYSQIVTTSYKTSEDFVKSYLCNLGGDQTLGHTFRQARNSFNKYSYGNDNLFRGVLLNGYGFYGNPLVKTTTPKMQEFDKAALEQVCGDFVGEKESFSLQSNEDSSKSIILDYAIISDGNYSIIDLSESFQLEEGELVLPRVVRSVELPRDAVIKNITYNFSFPEVEAVNIPYLGDNQTQTCDQVNASANFVRTYLEDTYEIIFEFYPVDLDCNMVTIYKKIEYNVEYEIDTPYKLDLQHPEVVKPSEEFNLSLDFDYFSDNVIESIKLFSEDLTIYEYESLDQPSDVLIPLQSNWGKGSEQFTLEIITNVSSQNLTFEIYSNYLDYEVEVPVQLYSDIVVNLLIYNNYNDNLLVEVDAKYMDTFDNEEILLAPGLNTLQYPLFGIEKSETSYPLIFEITHDGSKEIVNSLVVTNHAPEIHVKDTYRIPLGYDFELNYSVLDLESDTVDVVISDRLSSGFWTPDQIGNYTFTITASDEYLSSNRTFTVQVYENSIPTISDVSDEVIYDNETYYFSFSYSDDDYEPLEVMVPLEFEEIDSNEYFWVPNETGIYDFTYGVFDGYETVENTFQVTVRSADCIPQVICTSWSECSIGGQSRTCDDQCGLIYDETNDCSESVILDSFEDGSRSSQIENNQTKYIKIPKNAYILYSILGIGGEQ